MKYVVLIAALVLPTSAMASSIFDYSNKMTSDAEVIVDGRTFQIYVHSSRQTVLLEPAMKDMGGNPADWPLPIWRKAAETFVQPLGCGVSDVVALSRMGAAWEATYVCPPGVDLPALVKAQKPDLKRGVPIHP